MLLPCPGLQHGTELEVSRYIAVPEKWRAIGEGENAYCTDIWEWPLLSSSQKRTISFPLSWYSTRCTDTDNLQSGLLKEQGIINGLSNIYKHLWTTNSWLAVKRNWKLKNWMIKPIPTFQSCGKSILLCGGVYCEYPHLSCNVLNSKVLTFLLVISAQTSGHVLHFFSAKSMSYF